MTMLTEVKRDPEGRFLIQIREGGTPTYPVTMLARLSREELTALEEQIKLAKQPTRMPEAAEEDLGDLVRPLSAHRHAKGVRLDVAPYGDLRVALMLPTARLEEDFEHLRIAASRVLGGARKLWEMAPPPGATRRSAEVPEEAEEPEPTPAPARRLPATSARTAARPPTLRPGEVKPKPAKRLPARSPARAR